MSGRPWTDEARAQLVALIAAKAPVAEICEATGRTRGAIFTYMSKQGLRLRERTPQHVVDRIADLIERGWSTISVSRELGVTTTTIDYHARVLGVVGPRSTFRPVALPHDAEMLELALRGENVSAIARRLGMHRGSVACRLVTLARRDAIAEEMRDPPAIRQADNVVRLPRVPRPCVRRTTDRERLHRALLAAERPMRAAELIEVIYSHRPDGVPPTAAVMISKTVLRMRRSGVPVLGGAEGYRLEARS